MSSINISGNDQALLQFYQQVSSKASTPTAATSASAPASAASATGTDTAAGDSQTVQGAGHHHHHGHGGLFKKVESAVTTALEAAKSDPSADPNKVVEDAIAKVFKDNGVTPPVGGVAANGAGGPEGTDGDAGKDQAGASTSDGTAARQAFEQTLQSFGVSSDQFHSDFLAAIKDAQGGGGSDSSDVFKSFPPGSSVDTIA